MHFTKMHGLGNDYLYVYGEVPEDIERLSVKMSERHFGAGSDGMIYISPSDTADFKMRIFNADGSEAAMCGNGIRCVGKYVYDKGYTDKKHLKIETSSGVKSLDLQVSNGKVRTVSVDMGKAEVLGDITLDTSGGEVVCTRVCVGNNHAVNFVEDADAAPLLTLGPQIERHRAFPDGVNAEFVEAIDSKTLRMRVWERGSGVTMACGTGACAAAAAAAVKGYCAFGDDISVILDGGVVKIRVAPDCGVTMTGPAEMIYEGETVE